MDSARLLQQLADRLGAAHVLTAAAEIEPHCIDQRRRYRWPALAVVRPADVEQVQAVVALCREHGVCIVPQGGNTGLVGGATPLPEGRPSVILSTGRLAAVRAWHADAVTVEAGVVLDRLNELASERGLYLPVDLASSGSAQVGGLLATNAGGMRVIRHGMMRRQALGLEVVLPSGEVWSSLKPLLKNNLGYDLKQLFIGAEGTLGLITAATLQLASLPAATATAFVALSDIKTGMRLLQHLRQLCPEWLTAFELIGEPCLRLVQADGLASPVPLTRPWYALIELAGSQPEPVLEASLIEALQRAVLDDAVIARSTEQAQSMWAVRERIPDAQRRAGGNIKHDIGVPIDALPAFVANTEHALKQRFPQAQIIAFGHAGDGNLHYNVAHTRATPADTLLDEAEVNVIVYREVERVGGTISAEHGIGQLKRELLPGHIDPVGMALMRQLKTMLDPDNLFNPGKIV